MNKFLLCLALLLSLGLTASTPAHAKTATAKVAGTGLMSLSGEVTFEEVPEGLKINASFVELPSGKHGFHIHEKGDCGDNGNAAGGHFNPQGAPHGYLPTDGPTKAHAGDLGNIEADANGNAALEVVAPGLTLSEGPESIAGRAVVVHEKEDNFGQPTGNAGGRIGCGVIEVKE